MKRIAIVIFCALLAAGCHKQDPSAMPQMPPTAVYVTAAVSQDVPVYLDEIGACTARQFVSVTPQVTGPITEILFQDGAEIHKGDPLFTIDPRPYKAALDQAIANKAQSHAAVEYGKLEYDRMAGLLPSKAVSQDDFDKAKNVYDLAVAQLEASDAALETAKLNLEYCDIKSPVEGRAGQRLVDIGNVVAANQGSLLVIQTLDPIYADFTCAENDLPEVRRHASDGTLKVLIKLPSDTGDGRAGGLTFIDTQVQKQAGLVSLRATLANADRHFWPGQFVNVRVILALEKGAVLIPAAAEQVGQTGAYVYVVNKDSKAELRPIVAGQRQGELMVVEHGVSAGENVITVGQWMVIPGGPVHVMTPTAAAAPAGVAEAKS
jgi:membrane fusion protein, multidrug efflux system